MKRRHPLRTADYRRHIVEAVDNIHGYTAGLTTIGEDLRALRKQLEAFLPLA